MRGGCGEIRREGEETRLRAGVEEHVIVVLAALLWIWVAFRVGRAAPALAEGRWEALVAGLALGMRRTQEFRIAGELVFHTMLGSGGWTDRL